jgi:hypothetical protein
VKLTSDRLVLVLVLFVLPLVVGAAIVHSAIDLSRAILAGLGAA